MQDNKINVVPHFHGRSFCSDDFIKLDNIEAINERREEIYNLFKNGNVQYYSEMILENAFIDPNKELSEYDIKLLEDFLLREVENAFNNEQIITKEEFLEIIKNYVNNYKSCCGSFIYDKQSRNSFKNPHTSLQNKLLGKYDDDANYLTYVSKNLRTYSPRVDPILYNIQNNREYCDNLILKIKGKRNKTEERRTLKDWMKRTYEVESEVMEQNAFDPFIAMSKFPMHAVKFAMNNEDKFTEQFKIFKQNDNLKYLLLGMVFCTLHTEDEYNSSVKHDISQLKHIKKIQYKDRYLKQTEVDFYKIDAKNFKIAFPILVIKDGLSSDDRLQIMEKFNLNENDYERIVKCSPYNRRRVGQNYISEKSIFKNIYEEYSVMILEKIRSLLTKNQVLGYIDPKNKFCEMNPENKVDQYIMDVYSLAKTNNRDNLEIPAQNIPELLESKEINDRLCTVKRDILKLITKKDSLQKARKLLSEKLISEEKYETVCVSRLVSSINKGKKSIEENDAETAKILQKLEDRRYRDWLKDQKQKEPNGIVRN